MNFLVNTERLLNAIRRVSPVAGKPALNAILSHILLEAEGDALHLTAYDMELRIRTTIPATVNEGGAIAVPAQKFSEVVATLPMGDLLFETRVEAPEEIRLKCLKASYKLHGKRGENFPPADFFAEEWSFSMGGKELVDCLCKTSYARSADETRPQLSGILFSLHGTMRTIAATDGRRLALVESSLEPAAADQEGQAGGSPAREGEFILPSKVVKELVRSVDQSKTVTIRLAKSVAVFEFGETTLTSKLVDKAYPNYRSVIPGSFRNVVEIPRLVFMEVLRRVRTMVSENEESLSVTLSIQEHSMRISAFSQEYGNAEDVMDVELKGEPIEIAFNPNFLMDPLKYLSCDTFQLNYNDGMTQMEMTGDPGFIYILMPMRAVPPSEEAAPGEESQVEPSQE